VARARQALPAKTIVVQGGLVGKKVTNTTIGGGLGREIRYLGI